MAAEPLIVDADTAIGCLLSDVDDALALAYVLSLPENYELLGVTAVFGNARLTKTLSRAREVLDLAGCRRIPAVAGASSRKMLAEDTPAARFLIASAEANPGELTVLSLGPLTNIATAGLIDRDFFSRLKRLVIMGGAMEEGFGIPLVSPLEFNFLSDPQSARFVLGAGCEKVMITADLCRQVVFTSREVRAMFGMQNRVATYIAYRTLPWLRLNRLAPFLPWGGGFVPWDVVAAVFLHKPDLFSEFEEKGVSVARGRLPTGAVVSDPVREDRPVRIPRRLDPRGIADEFLRRLSTL